MDVLRAGRLGRPTSVGAASSRLRGAVAPLVAPAVAAPRRSRPVLRPSAAASSGRAPSPRRRRGSQESRGPAAISVTAGAPPADVAESPSLGLGMVPGFRPKTKDDSIPLVGDKESGLKEAPAVELVDGNLVVGGEVLLRGVSDHVSVSARAGDFNPALTGAGMDGAFLQVADWGNAFSFGNFGLGDLECHNFLACARCKLFWMTPEFGSESREVPTETQFMLIEVREGGPFALVMGLVDGAFRTTVRPEGEWKNGIAEEGGLQVRLESGCTETTAEAVSASLLLAAGDDPYALIAEGFKAASARTREWRPREEKEAPATLDLFGWCTWDAFYSKVSASGIEEGLRALTEAGVAPKTLIIDDGWQSVSLDSLEGEGWEGPAGLEPPLPPSEETAGGIGGALKPAWEKVFGAFAALMTDFYWKKVSSADMGTWPFALWKSLTHGVLRAPMMDHFNNGTDFTKRLKSVVANRKMRPGEDAPHDDAPGVDLLASLEPHPEDEVDDGFRSLVSRIKEEWGVEYVYCWHAIIGYWGGVSPEKEDALERGYEPRIKETTPSPGVLELEPAFHWEPTTYTGIGYVPKEQVSHFYGELHGYLARCGVDGVKVDAQCGIAAVGEGEGGSSEVAKWYHAALEGSIKRHFPGNHMINCMCHSTDNLYSHTDTAVARASDDFYPREPASHTTHLANCAFNSVFMGEICHMDWDMFHSLHDAAALHAAARAVSGGAVYVSDAPGRHDPELLRRLVLPGGGVLRAKLPARPTRDTLFRDVMRDGESALKIWNRNDFGGVVGCFNVQGSSWARSLRRFHTHDPSPGTVACSVRPSDVEGLPEAYAYATWTHEEGALRVVGPDGEVDLGRIEEKGHEVVTVVPVMGGVGGGAGAPPIQLAPLGLRAMLNGGGATTACDVGARGAAMRVRGQGAWIAYCRPQPIVCRVEGQRVPVAYDEATGLLEVELPPVDHSDARKVTLDF